MAAESGRDRFGKLGAIEIRLADRPRPYRHYFVDVTEERQDAAGTDVRAEAQRPRVREWKIDDWSGGFGFPIWTQAAANRYNKGRNVSPQFRTINYSGLVLGPEVSTAQDDSPATFAPGAGYLWRGSLPNNTYLTVYGVKTQALHPWLDASDAFDATAITAGSASGVARGLADCGDGFLYVVDTAADDVYKVDADAPTNVLHWDRSAAAAPKPTNPINIVAYRGEVYLLGNQGDLHLLDRSTTNTNTRVVDAFYPNNSTIQDAFNRITTSDVGPLWFHNTRLGTDIWEYNVAEDSAAIIGQLGPNAHPWSIQYVGGFVFVAYSAPVNRSVSPNIYLHYFRGGQTGTLGPLTEVPDGYHPQIAGVYQDRFILVSADYVQTGGAPFDLWAYDLGEGAWHHWAQGGLTPTNTGVGSHARLLSDRVLVNSTSGSTARVEVVDLGEYATISATAAYLDTGRYDFDLPSTQKYLMEITVLTEPLPANTTVEIQYSLDGGAWQDNSLDITADNATSTTFDLTAQADRFYELELRILLNSTSSTATPTVRAVTARALPISVEEYWDLEVDLNEQSYTETSGDTIHTVDLISSLQGLKTAKSVTTFQNPWEVDRNLGDSNQSESVMVVSLEVPDAHADETNKYARVRLLKSAIT